MRAPVWALELEADDAVEHLASRLAAPRLREMLKTADVVGSYVW